MKVTAFTQNQRNEVRILGDVGGALQAEPGMKQQTFLLIEEDDETCDGLQSGDDAPIRGSCVD